MRPWVLRALVMTLLYGVGQTVFVALSSRFVSLSLLWSVLLLGLLLLVGLVWGGAEVIADRIPEEWTWLKASVAAGPGAGLLTWILLAVFVDATGVEDLGSALVGRASFTILLILLSVTLGARFGWLSLRRSDDPRAEQDPGADTDGPADDTPDVPTTSAGASAAPPVLPSTTRERVAARRARRAGPEAPATPDDATRVPFGGGPFAEPSTPRTSSTYASPVVAVLPPVTPLPDRTSGGGASEDDAEPRESSARRRFGLRRPDDS